MRDEYDVPFLYFSDWPALWCILLNVARGKKSLDTPDIYYQPRIFSFPGMLPVTASVSII